MVLCDFKKTPPTPESGPQSHWPQGYIDATDALRLRLIPRFICQPYLSKSQYRPTGARMTPIPTLHIDKQDRNHGNQNTWPSQTKTTFSPANPSRWGTLTKSLTRSATPYVSSFDPITRHGGVHNESLFFSTFVNFEPLVSTLNPYCQF